MLEARELAYRNRDGTLLWRIFWFLMLFAVALFATAFAEATESGPSSGTAESSAPVTPSALNPARAKKQKLTIGLYVASGILFVGCALLLWIVWWGGRVRRRLLQPLPSAPRGNELWYLKTPLAKDSEDHIPDAGDDSTDFDYDEVPR